MHRDKKIIILSHCILNQNSVVKPLARAKGPYNNIIKKILEKNIGIIQLPCPEFLFLGENRPPKNKDEYDTLQYRNLCKNITKDMVYQIKEYKNNGYKILGIIGIEESPSCGLVNKKGIFMEELTLELKKENINLPVFEVPVDYEENKDNSAYLKKLETFISV